MLRTETGMILMQARKRGPVKASNENVDIESERESNREKEETARKYNGLNGGHLKKDR
jgi:hypothetical protein